MRAHSSLCVGPAVAPATPEDNQADTAGRNVNDDDNKNNKNNESRNDEYDNDNKSGKYKHMLRT